MAELPPQNWFQNLSFGAEFHPAAKKAYQETVLFSPFHAGKKLQMRRHVELVQELGFDAVDFEYDTGVLSLPNRLVSSQNRLGYKHVWADQVERLFNEIPGRKIVFSFSNPTAGVIEAIARRKAADITGMICDGGPTSRYWTSLVKYFTTEFPVPSLPARWAMATLTTPLWTLNPSRGLAADLARFPKNFPLLSIRGWKDHLIPPQHIDEVFEPHAQLDWRKLSLPEGDHLNGLRDFPEEYRPAVAEFLQQIARPI